MRHSLMILVLLISAPAYGQFQLAPGETLVAIDGVPVANARMASPRVGGSDQARCEAEAREMARRGYRGHLGGLIGRFEGVGWASHSRPSTCTPRSRMRLTGDAVARGRGGYYRVRSWR